MLYEYSVICTLSQKNNIHMNLEGNELQSRNLTYMQCMKRLQNDLKFRTKDRFLRSYFMKNVTNK